MILHYLADHFGKFQGSDAGGAALDPVGQPQAHELHRHLRYMVTLAKVGEPQVHEFLRGRVKGFARHSRLPPR